MALEVYTEGLRPVPGELWGQVCKAMGSAWASGEHACHAVQQRGPSLEKHF